MSLKNFSELFADLDSNNSNNAKIELLKNYFLSNKPLENAWTIYFLTGKNNKRFVSGKYLKKIFSDLYEYPMWLIDSCYLKVGDSAEVISLLLKNERMFSNKIFETISLNEIMVSILPEILVLDEPHRKLKIRRIWEQLPKESHLVFNKILTGSFRIGVSIGLITKSISKLIHLDEEIISHRLMGYFNPSIESYELYPFG